MTTYIIRRLLLVPVLLFGVTILIFGMLQFLDPDERVSLYIRGDPKSDAQVNSFIKRYCLDCPIHMQYKNWLLGTIDSVSGEREGGILFGNFGWSKSGSQQATRSLMGEHDFSSFQSVGSPKRTAVRTVTRAEWKRSRDGFLRFEIEANGFLKQMVRAIVGTLVEVGRRKITSEEFQKIFDSRDRKKAGPTAPAHGLFLKEVKY